jgi:hypothetical protein
MLFISKLDRNRSFNVIKFFILHHAAHATHAAHVRHCRSVQLRPSAFQQPSLQSSATGWKQKQHFAVRTRYFGRIQDTLLRSCRRIRRLQRCNRSCLAFATAFRTTDASPPAFVTIWRSGSSIARLDRDADVLIVVITLHLGQL